MYASILDVLDLFVLHEWGNRNGTDRQTDRRRVAIRNWDDQKEGPVISQCVAVDLACAKLCRVFSKRQRITLRLLYAIGRPSVVCLSVVCDVGAPYSGG